MEMLLGLYIIIGQVLGIVKLFGGLKDIPKWFDIIIAVAMILMIVSMFGLVSDL